MRIKDYKELIAEFPCQELNYIRNAMMFVYESIEDWEFQTRLGIERKGFFHIIEKINTTEYFPQNTLGENDNHLEDDESLNIIIKITKAELGIMGNALNEVCNGFHISEFEKIIGANKKVVSSLLDQIGTEYYKIPEQ